MTAEGAIRVILLALVAALVACDDDSESDAQDPVVELLVDEGCATLSNAATGEVVERSCREASTNPKVLWSGEVDSTAVALLRIPATATQVATEPPDRLTLIDDESGFGVVELGSGPATVLVLRQAVGDFRCTVQSVSVTCEPAA